MKRIITIHLLLYFSISFAMEQPQLPSVLDNDLYGFSEHAFIRDLITANNKNMLQQLKKLPMYGNIAHRDFGKDALESTGLAHAAEIGNAHICKFLLDIGICIGNENPLLYTNNEEVIQAIYTNCIGRPNSYKLKTAYQRSIAFLCCAKKVCPLMPKDIRIKILGEAGIIGDLMIKKLLKGLPIKPEFFAHTQARLFTTTLTCLNYLHKDALTRNPEHIIPAPRKFKDEILATIAQRMTSKPLLCNTKIREPQIAPGQKHTTGCLIF